MRASPSLRYVPARLSIRARPLFRTALGVDAVVVQCAPPRAGLLSLGTEVNVFPAAIEEARRRGGIVVAQINEQMPYTYGDSQVDVADVDLAVEISEPLRSPGDRVVDDVSRCGRAGRRGAGPGRRHPAARHRRGP